MAITDWHENDRPREKLLNFGEQHLSDAELLAIFLRVGVKGKSAVDLAQDLIDEFGDLTGLLNANQKQFCQAKGLGEAKYAQLRAVLEMAKRYFESGLQKGQAFTQPETVAKFLHFELGNINRERFGLLLLDQQNQLIKFELLFEGTLNQAQVHAREVVSAALQNHAAAVILAHNHPSGDPSPSQADIELTKFLSQALDLIDVRTLDHIIIGDSGRWYSLAKEGQMPHF